MVEDPMGLETNIYQQVQKSTDLISQELHFQPGKFQPPRDEGVTIEEQDNLKVQPLSILQTPSTIVSNAKTPKERGKPKGTKIKIEIAVGIQTTLDNSFNITKRSTRRTRCSPCPQ